MGVAYSTFEHFASIAFVFVSYVYSLSTFRRCSIPLCQPVVCFVCDYVVCLACVCVCVCASMWIFCCLLAIVSIVPITLLNMPFNTISDLSRIRRNRFFPSLADNDRKRTIMNVSDDYATSVGLSIAFIRWTIVLATIHRTRTYNAEARIFCGSDNEILYLSRTEFMIAVARRFLFPFTTRLRFAPLPAAQMFIIYFGFDSPFGFDEWLCVGCANGTENCCTTRLR